VHEDGLTGRNVRTRFKAFLETGGKCEKVRLKEEGRCKRVQDMAKFFQGIG
jgi:hypothetical protein